MRNLIKRWLGIPDIVSDISIIQRGIKDRDRVTEAHLNDMDDSMAGLANQGNANVLSIQALAREIDALEERIKKLETGQHNLQNKGDSA